MTMLAHYLIMDPAQRDDMAAVVWAVASRLTLLELAVHGLAAVAGPETMPRETNQSVKVLARSITSQLACCRDDLAGVERHLDDLPVPPRLPE